METAEVIVLVVVVTELVGAAVAIVHVEGLRRRRKPTVTEQPQAAQDDDADGGNAEPTATPVVTDQVSTLRIGTHTKRWGCGHVSWSRRGFDFYGSRCDYKGPSDLCGDCLLAKVRPHVIRCCACGCAIVPGAAVAVYDDDGSFKAEWTTRTPDGSVIGCLRMECCPSGGFFGGHWTDTGFASRFAAVSLAAEAMASGKPMGASFDEKGAKITEIDEEYTGRKNGPEKID